MSNVKTYSRATYDRSVRSLDLYLKHSKTLRPGTIALMKAEMASIIGAAQIEAEIADIEFDYNRQGHASVVAEFRSML